MFGACDKDTSYSAPELGEEGLMHGKLQRPEKYLALSRDPNHVCKDDQQFLRKVVICLAILDDPENCEVLGPDAAVPNEGSKSVVDENRQRLWIYKEKKHLPLFVVTMY